MSSLRVIQFFLVFLALCHAKPNDSNTNDNENPAEEVCSATNGCGASLETKTKINTKRRIIFDSDPGLDDAFALIWLLEGYKNDLYSIEALTSIEGNISPLDTYRNIMHMVNITTPGFTKETRNIRTKLKSIPIGKMHKKDGTTFTALDSFFGMDGFNGLSDTFKDFPNVFASQSKVKKWFKNVERTPYSEDLIIDKLLAFPNEISILCAGPVTNLYRAELKHPGILSLAKDIYIMGGTFESGNVDANTEFNFAFDSNALYEFFEIINGIKGRVPNVFIFPLDVTRKLEWNVEQFELLYSLLDNMKQSEIEMCRMKIEGVDEDIQSMYDVQEEDVYCTQTGLMYHFLEKATEKQIIAHYELGIGDYMELHDLALVGFMAYPQLFDFKYVKCMVESANGMIYFDKRLSIPKPETMSIPNCMVALKVNHERFIKAFTRDMLIMLNNL